jgi:hypothetical protein
MFTVVMLEESYVTSVSAHHIAAYLQGLAVLKFVISSADASGLATFT